VTRHTYWAFDRGDADDGTTGGITDGSGIDRGTE
jgi:hypothetical protein